VNRFDSYAIMRIEKVLMQVLSNQTNLALMVLMSHNGRSLDVIDCADRIARGSNQTLETIKNDLEGARSEDHQGNVY
jgi:hypothetical protein